VSAQEDAIAQTDFRVPAEWEPHAACWLAWPSHPELWGDDLEPARAAVRRMCEALAGTNEALHVVTAVGPVEGIRAQFHPIPFGDIWLRDTGPIFGRAGSTLHAARFAWNGWGGKYDFVADHAVGDAIARIAGAQVARHSWILEGGAVELDGSGTCMTTRQCLLNPNRNPHMDAAAVEGALAAALGVARVVWLGNGLHNDHTDGHIDNLARFVGPGVAACMEPDSADDPNRDVLTAARADLERAGLDLALIPSAGRVTDAHGSLMPASYLNFYIGNQVVIVPTFDQSQDDRALAAIEALFPDRTVVGINALGLLTGGGGFHCMTREQPQ
jgi:agmatine deiminase